MLLAADNINVAQNVGFGIIAVMMIFAALCVVTTKNVVHAALWLVLVLAGVAAQYILAAAEFVAVSQVLVYVGAVMVLFLFGIMLTRAQIGARAGPQQPQLGLGRPGRRSCCSACCRGPCIDVFGDDTLPDDRRPDADRGASPTTSCRRTSCRSSPSRSSCSPPPSAPSSWPGRTERVLAANFLLLGAVLFCIGVFGVLARRNAVMVLMSVELILNAVNLNLLAFALMHGNVDGQVFALYVIAVAAAEVGVGLGMVLLVYRNRRSIALDELSEMKG